MKDYASMSDQKINQMVGCKVGEMKLGARSCCCIGSDGNVLVLKGGMWKVFDPCNNPADAWPIIVENRISIKSVLYSQWMAEDYLEEISSLSQNPLRSAMIVFLMMKEGEK